MWYISRKLKQKICSTSEVGWLDARCDAQDMSVGVDEGGARRGGGVSSSLLGPVVPSFQAPSGRLKFTVRHHQLNKGSLSVGVDERG